MSRRICLILVAILALTLRVNGFAAGHGRRGADPNTRQHVEQLSRASCRSNVYSPSTLQQTSLQAMSFSLSANSQNHQENGIVSYYRARLRDITGFSLTALRAVLRAMTGISMTALYTSALTLSGAWIRAIMTSFLSIWPTWLRYFVQPFLVLYYAPLLVIRNAAGPNRQRARTSHESFVEGWEKAVEIADGSTQYWPIHVNSQNELESDIHELDMTEAIAESSFLSMEMQEKGRLEAA